MKTRFATKLITAAAAALILSGCGTMSETAGAASPDRVLANDVRERVSSDPDAGRCNIGITVTDGVVTLDGNVPNDNVRLRVKDIARGTEGVKGVVDNLQSH